jgi:hypothetical protein
MQCTMYLLIFINDKWILLQINNIDSFNIKRIFCLYRKWGEIVELQINIKTSQYWMNLWRTTTTCPSKTTKFCSFTSIWLHRIELYVTCKSHLDNTFISQMGYLFMNNYILYSHSLLRHLYIVSIIIQKYNYISI